MAVVKVAIQRADHDPGLDPTLGARAEAEAKVVAEATKKKAGVQAKMTKAGAAVEVPRNPEVKRSQKKWFKMMMMIKQRAEVPAKKRVRVKAGAGVLVKKGQRKRREGA